MSHSKSLKENFHLCLSSLPALKQLLLASFIFELGDLIFQSLLISLFFSLCRTIEMCLFDCHICNGFKRQMEFNVERRLSKMAMKDSEDIGQCENDGESQMTLSRDRVRSIEKRLVGGSLD